MNEKTTYVKKSKKFTQVSHHIIQNKNLSMTEIGMMTKFLSYMDSFVIHKETEQKKSGMGRVAFNNSWKTLEKEGYIKSEQVRSEGHIKYKYTISNMPLNDNITECDQVADNHQQETDGGELTAENNSQFAADTNLVVDNGRLNTDDSNELSNIYVSNKEIINIEDSNKKLNNIELSNQNIINIELTNVDYTNRNITNIKANDNIINNSLKVDVIENNNIGNSTSVQETALNIIRKKIIDNKVLPFYVELTINEVKISEEYIYNKDNFNVDDWVDYFMEYVEIEKYYNSNNSSSIYYKCKRMLDNYILTKDIDKAEAYTRVQNFFKETSFSKGQVSVTNEMFNHIVNKCQLYLINSSSYKSGKVTVSPKHEPTVEPTETTNTTEDSLSYSIIDDVLGDSPTGKYNYDEPIRFL